MSKVTQIRQKARNFLQKGKYDKAIEEYKQAVTNMIESESRAIDQANYISEQEKSLRKRMLGETNTYFSSVFDEAEHEKKRKRGELKFSHRATISALLINQAGGLVD